MGEAGLAEYIERQFDLTAEVYDYLESLPDFECPVAPQSNILCFRVKGARDGQLALRDRLLARGDYYVSSASLNGQRYLRLTLTNPGLVDEIRELIATSQ
jgi:L-2,4-diaminobutyrate decarboxylase